MKPIIKHIGRLILLGLMVYCFGMSILYSEGCIRNRPIYMLYQKNKPVGGKEAIKMQEQEEEEDDPVEFTVWGVKENTELLNEELGRVTKGTALYIAGDAGLLFDYDGVYEKDDREGCLLSEDLAYDLFGSKNIKDFKVKLGGKELVVRGLLKDAAGTIVQQAEKDTDEIMDSAAVFIPEGRLASSVLETFTNRHGFGVDNIAFPVFEDWAKTAVMLVPLVMGIYLAYVWGKSLHRMRKQEKAFYWFFICLAAGICFLVLYIKIMGISLAVPKDFTPSKWSDFSFWSDLMEENRNRLLALFSAEKREPEKILIQPFLQTMKYSTFTLAIYVCFVRRYKMDAPFILYVYALCGIFFAYLTILVNKESAQVLAGDNRLWLLAAVYLTGAYLLTLYDS